MLLGSGVCADLGFEQVARGWGGGLAQEHGTRRSVFKKLQGQSKPKKEQPAE